MTDINELIHHRRSIYPKQFTPGARVSDNVVKQMLENANWAPTHHLTQPWFFNVYTGDALITLAEAMQAVYKNHTPIEQFDQSKFDKIADNVYKSSHVIAIGMKRSTTGKIPPLAEEEWAVACAVQNIYLTASAYGVGCFWSTGGITFMEAAKSLFGLANDDRLMGFLYIGQYDGIWPKGVRKPMDTKVVWHQ